MIRPVPAPSSLIVGLVGSMSPILAIDASQWRNYATFGAFVPIVVGLVIMKLVANAVVRTLTLAIALGLGALIFLQRDELATCVDDARQNLENDVTSVSCTVLGFDIDVDL